jgi:hypothetical protein
MAARLTASRYDDWKHLGLKAASQIAGNHSWDTIRFNLYVVAMLFGQSLRRLDHFLEACWNDRIGNPLFFERLLDLAVGEKSLSKL